MARESVDVPRPVTPTVTWSSSPRALSSRRASDKTKDRKAERAASLPAVGSYEHTHTFVIKDRTVVRHPSLT
jgi:hypothetical protein